MTKDDIIRMAREAGFGNEYWSENDERFVRFAALVAAAEREECAKLCDELANEAENSWQYRMGASWSATRIRARGQND